MVFAGSLVAMMRFEVSLAVGNLFLIFLRYHFPKAGELLRGITKILKA